MSNYLISFKDIRSTIDRKQYKKGGRTMVFKEGGRQASVAVLPTANHSKYYTEKDKCYSFIITQSDRTNMLYKITASKLYVSLPHYGIERWFEFSIRQMKQIETLSNNTTELQDFFKQLLFLNKRDIIILDFEKLENTTPILFKCWKKRYQAVEDKSNSNWVIGFV
jgi:hypothetical protein